VRRQKVTLAAGVDETLIINYLAGGVAVDFTGCTARCAFYVTPDDAAPLVQVSTTSSADGQIKLGTPGGDPAVGLLRLELTAAGTTKLTAPVVHADLLITWADGIERHFLAIDADIHPRGPFQ